MGEHLEETTNQWLHRTAVFSELSLASYTKLIGLPYILWYDNSKGFALAFLNAASFSPIEPNHSIYRGEPKIQNTAALQVQIS